MTSKLIRDGFVAVLYSPGYGAGWSTWCVGDQRMSMLFDPQIADIVDRGGETWPDQAEAIARVKYPDAYFNINGLKNLRVCWIESGTRFRVTEYDGDESIEIISELDWITA